ncbi:GNAT family N-acetyltransferase [Niabella yanshanensis]|uniref:GNAT family N-acetyltransferase n=1 Tax=Niabella yanshanensis TaxID=577386 RepID=A0ABZ0WBZ3_9BACT|nr:GNAT family N-acetyltransferase [Niabella yanshanensis]WQD39671.1 GNAT family N-acetyltransferase [Niabella yanshanensis]
MIIETNRVLIRKVTHNDLEALYTICGDPRLMRFVGDGKPLSMKQTQKWIDVTINNYASKGFGMYGVVDRETGAFIGYCGLVFSADVKDNELIYALVPAYWGKGLATEIARHLVDFGFSSLNLEHIYASIDPENKASERILLKVGFNRVFRKNDEFGLETVYYLKKRPR